MTSDGGSPGHVKSLSYGVVRVHPSSDVGAPFRADVFFTELRPLFLVFRAMGVLPVQRPAPGAASFKVVSFSMFYSVLLYLLMAVPMTVSAIKTTEGLTKEILEFNDFILAALHFAYAHQFWIIPIVNWRDVGRMASYLNSWTQFQELFERTTGTPLQLVLRRRVWCLLALSAVATAVCNLARYNFADVWNVLPSIYLHYLLNLLAVLWDVVCRALGQASDQVAARLQEALLGEGSPKLLAERRLLWMRLSSLTRNYGDAIACTFSHFCLFMFLTLLAGAYGAICDMTDSGFNTNQPWILSVFIHSGVMLYVLCNSAHVASAKAGTDIQEAILLTDLSAVSPDTKSEVELLLLSMSTSCPEITLRGHVRVNRGMLVSLLSTVVTYLVVLLQFKLSLTQGTAAAPSPTGPSPTSTTSSETTSD